MERLVKYISSSGLFSKKESERLILNGDVLVNSKIILELGYIVEDTDKVTINGIDIKPQEERLYYILNKPFGYITSFSSAKGTKSTSDLLSDIKVKLSPLNKLDFEDTGLIILSNDNNLKNNFINSYDDFIKEYKIKIDGIIKKEELNNLKKKLHFKLYDLSYNAEKTSSILRISLKDTKIKDLKKEFNNSSFKIKSLKLEKIENISLDIKEGFKRPLKPYEIKILKLKAMNKI